MGYEVIAVSPPSVCVVQARGREARENATSPAFLTPFRYKQRKVMASHFWICTQRAVDYSAIGATDQTDVIRQARKHVNIDTASPRSQQ